MIDYVPFGVTKFLKINRLKKLVSYRKSIDTVDICTNLLGIVSI